MHATTRTAARPAAEPRAARARPAPRPMPEIETARRRPPADFMPDEMRGALRRRTGQIGGLALFAATALAMVALASWSADDPSFSRSSAALPANLLGRPGAIIADLLMQMFGLAALAVVLPPAAWGWRILSARAPRRPRLRLAAWVFGAVLAAGFAACLPRLGAWPLPTGLGGVLGEGVLAGPAYLRGGWLSGLDYVVAGTLCLIGALLVLPVATGLGFNSVPEEAAEIDEDAAVFEEDEERGGVSLGALTHGVLALRARLRRLRRRGGALGIDGARAMLASAREAFGLDEAKVRAPLPGQRVEPRFNGVPAADREPEEAFDDRFEPIEDAAAEQTPLPQAAPARPAAAASGPRRPPLRSIRGGRAEAEEARRRYARPSFELLAPPPPSRGPALSSELLTENARELEGVLEDFGVRGAIVNARPGPVVTLYELEPAPGIKSSRVIGLADDIARSMSAIACRVAVVPGRNAIGIELPNPKREKVLLREMLASSDYTDTQARLPLCLCKTIGGDPVIVDLARMPHLLIAGTTGSGKSVAINTMILSLLYRHRPEQCRLIMIDPKMLELSVYDGIPHLLSP
ncbi:MAG: DNA translocase FtsK 4TM domain-containing protein, partial [Xanthobacteraceae bacterium]